MRAPSTTIHASCLLHVCDAGALYVMLDACGTICASSAGACGMMDNAWMLLVCADGDDSV